ncbi:MAG TPA: helix-turn-helix transcriptional regulator [Devosia sp.]|uniref:helix-turn-helix domain-containing protein n=1 Tax=Devosia sp. TaxID=1871048 RepID=UPI002DDD9DCA|nr:helix-turn-helix transcriptional regulator [Devosia sp.]HEV2516609.1 helix-turn-helix transcriptional regulator [Devosia sp.]
MGNRAKFGRQYLVAEAKRQEAAPEERPQQTPASSTQFLRQVLRDARKQRGLSQMELALRLGFSPRHISFVEVGRSRPSRSLIERWLAEVGAQPSVRRAALLHAGFAPTADRAEADPMAPAIDHPTELMDRLLTVHDPFPAFAFDADWRIRRANRAARWLMGQVMPDYLRTVPNDGGLDMVMCCAHASGLLSNMHNAATFGYAHLAQLELEAVANPLLRPGVEALALSLAARFGERPIEPAPSAQVHFSFSTPHGQLDFLRFQCLIDLPQDVTLRSMRVELSLPLNDLTREVMRRAV